jgi:hypothetical protein
MLCGGFLAKDQSDTNVSIQHHDSLWPRRVSVSALFQHAYRLLVPPSLARALANLCRREKAKADRDNYYKKRKQDKQKHMKRTARGQPVTKNIISGILDKLQQE